MICAGLAFHPLDGILQAVPHVIALFLVPMHFTTHIGLLFLEAIWTANIHDCIHAKIWPVMGAGYHTIHHTTYRHNYGHYTIWMDWMFGTLCDPVDDKTKVLWSRITFMRIEFSMDFERLLDILSLVFYIWGCKLYCSSPYISDWVVSSELFWTFRGV